MKKLLIFIFVTVSLTPNSIAEVWNSRADFSKAQGHKNWHYLQNKGGFHFVPMVFSMDDNTWKGDEKYCIITQNSQHPGNTSRSVRKWVAPYSGRFKISGPVHKTNNLGDGVNFWIKMEPTKDWHIPVWQKEILNTTISIIDRCIWIEEGESIYFFVDKRNSLSNDNCSVDITIETVPIIDIPLNNNIQNQSDANTGGSIAWFFQRYGTEKTYRLINAGDNQAYVLRSKLRIPQKSSLINGSSEQYVKLYAVKNPDFFNVMVELNNESSLKGIQINAQNSTNLVIEGSRKALFRIDYCLIQNSRNDYSTHKLKTRDGKLFDDIRPHLVHILSCSYSLFTNNVFRNAGYPKANGSNWPSTGRASLVYALGSNDVTFLNNDIANALCHGLNINDAINIMIKGNVIQNTGMNKEFDSYDRLNLQNYGDGIGGYHPVPRTKILNYKIIGNTIRNSMNHAIHVSGINIEIKGNVLKDGKYYGIYLQDWRCQSEPLVYAKDCVISNNTVTGFRPGYLIKVENYCKNTISVSNNNVKEKRNNGVDCSNGIPEKICKD